MKKIKAIDIFNYFYIVSLIAMTIYCIINSENILNNIISDSGIYGCDFAYPVIASKDLGTIYNNGWNIYTPLTYICYSLFSNLISVSSNYSLIGDSFIQFSHETTVNFIYIIITTIQILALTFIIQSIFKNSNYKHKIVLPIFLSISLPLMHLAIYNANSIVLCTLFIIISIFFIDSENKIFSELSIISLAIATVLKVYPALLALYYIKKKDIKKFFRLLVYTMLLLIIPFFIIDSTNTINLIYRFINNVLYFSNSVDSINKMSITSIFFKLFNSFNINISNTSYIYTIIINVYLIYTIIMFFIANNKFHEFYFLIIGFTHYAKNTFSYYLVYYLPILLLFLFYNEIISLDLKSSNSLTNNTSKAKHLYITISKLITIILLSIVFIPFSMITKNNKINISVCYILMLLQTIEVILSTRHSAKSNTST